MSRGKTSHRIRRAKNARTGNQILLRKIGAAYGRAAAKVTSARIERYRQLVRALQGASLEFAGSLHQWAQSVAAVYKRHQASSEAQQ